jgi:hypothetical protein
MIPRTRPQQKRQDTERQVKSAGVTDPVCLVGIRGYYRDSMGAKGKNDRGIYDDALILVSPNVHATFNANVDPGAHGINPKVRKGYASLKPGVYRYKVGKHGIRSGNPYTALVQAAAVTVQRDCGLTETGWFGINIHKGSTRSVSSEGCQTIPPAQWDAFITLVQSEMKRNNAKTLSYVLTSK